MPLNYNVLGLVEPGFQTQYGLTATYFKIGQLYIDYTTNTGFVNYLGYENELKAFSGTSPIKSVEVRLDPLDITGIYGIANTQSNLSVTGASIISHFDSKVLDPQKGTVLSGKTRVNYPAGAYPCEECGGGFG